MKEIVAELERRRSEARLGGGQKRIDAQHKRGKLTARERISSSSTMARSRNTTCSSSIAASISAWRRARFRATASSPAGAQSTAASFMCSPRISRCSAARSPKRTRRRSSRCRIWRCSNRAPIVGLFDAGGARIQEGVAALGGYGEVFQRNVTASGVIPQISVIMGPCAGGDVYSPAMTDFIFMVRDTSYMFVTGPDVVKTVTNEEVTAEELGGASVHARARPSPTAPSTTMSSACCRCAGCWISCPRTIRSRCRTCRRRTISIASRSRSTR